MAMSSWWKARGAMGRSRLLIGRLNLAGKRRIQLTVRFQSKANLNQREITASDVNGSGKRDAQTRDP
jgi:hypothetical protein